MRQVFRTRPWVLPREPEPFAKFFRDSGKELVLEKGHFLTHGGDSGDVAFLVDGLVTFSFVDLNSLHHIFALVLPGRTIGDLDALNPQGTNVLAECIRPSRVLTVSNEQWREFLRQDIGRMELYADMSILKEECVLEGTFANFTFELDTRLRVLLYCLVFSCGVEPDKDGWYSCPLSLTVTEFAQIVAANRSWVSTKFSEWCKEGTLRKVGRSIECHERLFATVHDWMRNARNVRPRLDGCRL